MCVDNMYFYMPVIDMEKARMIMLYIRDRMNRGQTDILAPTQQEIALIFAIQGKNHNQDNCV